MKNIIIALLLLTNIVGLSNITNDKIVKKLEISSKTLSFDIPNPSFKDCKTFEDSVFAFIDHLDLNPEIVTNLLPVTRSNKLTGNNLNINHKEIVKRQALIESGRFKSNVFNENNNMFGMRMPYKRATLAIGQNRGYAVYKHWTHSIIDYAMYQEMGTLKTKDKQQYINYLGKHYAEDPKYANKLRV